MQSRVMCNSLCGVQVNIMEERPMNFACGDDSTKYHFTKINKYINLMHDLGLH